MAHGFEDLHPETIRREIDRAGAATLLTRRTLRSLWVLAAAFIAQVVVMLVLYPSSYELGALLGISAALALAGGLLWGLSAPLARVFRGWQCARLELALRRVDRQDLADVLWSMRAHPLPDTQAIVDTLIHDLRPLGSELSPSPPDLASGIEVTPVPRRRRRSRSRHVGR